MKTNRLLASLLAFVLALSAFGLAACGGGSASEGTAQDDTAKTEEAATPSGPADEELIAADIEKVIGTTISKEELLTGMREDNDMLELEKLGLDLEAYAANMEGKFKLEISGIDVDGDKAVAHVALTSPDFGDEATAMMEKRADELIQDLDVESMTEEEFTAWYMGVVSDILADPSFPTRTETMDIDYVKKGDSWEMADESAVESEMSDIANAGLDEAA